MKRYLVLAITASFVTGILSVSSAMAAMTATQPVAFDTSSLGFGPVESRPDQVSCWSPGSCALVGEVSDPVSGDDIPFVSVSTNEVWSPPSLINFPSGLVNGDATLRFVSCGADGTCAATGLYDDQNGVRQGFTTTYIGGTWSTAQPFTYSSPAVNILYVQVFDIDCVEALSCVVVGSRHENGVGNLAFTIDAVGGVFSDVRFVDFPVGVPHIPNDSLESVSCGAPGECTAIGYMSPDGGSSDRIFTISSIAGSWSIPEFLPFETGFGGGLTNAISCPTPTDCTAGGWTYGPNSTFRAWLAVLSPAGWTVEIIDTPSDGGGTNPWQVIESVSCASSTSCVAAGHYTDSTGSNGFLLTTNDGWATFSSTALLGNSDLVSCAPSGQCLAVGGGDVLLVGYGGSDWTPPQVISVPTGLSDPNVVSISCTSGGVCGVLARAQDSDPVSRVFTLFVSVGSDPAPTTTTISTDDRSIAPAFTG